MIFLLYSLLGLIALVFVTALFVKKDYTVKREIVINQSPEKLYDFLRYLKNHKAFNAWYLKDPRMKEISRNTDGEIGYVFRYEGNKDLGVGEQELKGLQQNKKIDIELRFIKPFKSTCNTPFELEAIGNNQTKVTWTMFGKTNYPMNFALLFINMNTFLGKDIQKSLENLKTKLEE